MVLLYHLFYRHIPVCKSMVRMFALVPIHTEYCLNNIIWDQVFFDCTSLVVGMIVGVLHGALGSLFLGIA